MQKKLLLLSIPIFVSSILISATSAAAEDLIPKAFSNKATVTYQEPTSKLKKGKRNATSINRLFFMEIKSNKLKSGIGSEHQFL